MKRSLLITIAWLLCLLGPSVNAQVNIAEYFFDTDPGIGNGVALMGLSPGSGTSFDSVLYNANITVPLGMLPGQHRLYIRVANENNGKAWSQCEMRPFYVHPSNGNDIVQMEYFVDDDPGVENGTAISFIASHDSAYASYNIPTSGLSTGYHEMIVRSKNANGMWSQNERRRIYVNQSGTQTSIDKLEYFYDHDPGVGLGYSMNLNGTMDSSVLNATLTTSGLATGKHQLYVRARTNDGKWSLYERKAIHVVVGGNSVTHAEYFFDHDPGSGNGIPLSIASSDTLAEFSSGISTVGLTRGAHQLAVRFKSEAGAWGMYESKKINVTDNPIAIEYFFDNDPGPGNGLTQLLSSLNPGVAEWNGGVLTTYNLFHGQHRLFTRVQSASGLWSQYDSAAIYINCSNPVVGTVVQNLSIGACGDPGVQLTLQNSLLNEGTQWNWYANSCGGTLLGHDTSIFVSPEDTTTYYVRGEGGCTNVFTCTTIPVNYNPTSQAKLRMFIQGYYLGGQLMTTALDNEGQPSCANVTDTVTIELHDPTTYNLVTSQKAILHTNGFVRCDFSPLTGSYYFVVKHRNGLETWSSQPIPLNNELMHYDFTTSDLSVYGNNMKQVENGVWAFYSGDITMDGAIDLFDYLEIDPDIYNGVGGYYATDINGDGSVDLFDYLILSANIQNGIGSITP